MIINDYYKVLGVSPKASGEELRKAYRMLARQYHPDSGDGKDTEEMFSLVSEAYSMLSDPVKRNEYNKENGYPFFEDIDLGGSIDSSPDESKSDDSAQGAAEQTARNEGPPKIVAGTSFENLRSKMGEHDLKVGHKVALTSEEELERIKSSDDEGIGAWGDDEAETDGAVGKSGRGLLSIFKRKNEEHEKRQFLKQELRRKLDEEMHPMQPVRVERPTNPEAPKNSLDEPGGFANYLQEERKFQFQITSFEQAIGTTRQVALQGRLGEDPRRITVDIPPGTKDGDAIEVAQGWERVNVEISVVQDPFVRVHGSEILLRFPVTIAEAAHGRELRVPTVGGSMLAPMKSPQGNGNHIVLQGKGLGQSGSDVHGDMRVFPLIALPRTISPLVQAAIDTIEKHYVKPVRADFEAATDSSEYFYPDGDDGVLMVPISVSEYLTGVELTIQLRDSSVPLSVPGPWKAAKDIELEGALIDEEGTVGTLLVVPYISLPEELDAEVLGAADSIEAAYTSAVRAEMPGRLASVA